MVLLYVLRGEFLGKTSPHRGNTIQSLTLGGVTCP